MKMQYASVLLLGLLGTAPTQAGQYILPPKNELALTPENFCLGFKNVFAISKQDIQGEADQICPAQVPSALLRTLLSTAYAGVGQPTVTTLLIQETPATQTSQIMVAYAMKIPKTPVQALLGEEKHVPSQYAVEPLTIRPKFGTPVANLGDADTAFTVEQRTTVRDNVSFDDNSIHDLKLYRMHPNNFDFFAAARTLRAPSEQFKKAVVLRAVMRDPANPNGSISVTVLNFVMNSREEHERVVENFSAFILADFRALYTEQSK